MFKKIFPVYRSESKRGRKFIKKIENRRALIYSRDNWNKVEKIVETIRKNKFKGLKGYLRKFEKVRISTEDDLWIELDYPSTRLLPRNFESAFERSRNRLETSQDQLMSKLKDLYFEIAKREIVPLDRVGIYVPGAVKSYVSTAVMTIIPAQVAGVKEIVVATPRNSLNSSPAMRFVLRKLGIEKVLAVGGVGAITTLAYGLDVIGPVDKIVGPGGVWTSIAKRIVAKDVDIDMCEGPSEMFIVSDDSADVKMLAFDMLAQAEHDPYSTVVLITDSYRLALSVREEMVKILEENNNEKIEDVLTFLAGALVAPREKIAELIRLFAPQQLQLIGGMEELFDLSKLRASLIMLGERSPAIFADYLAGIPHVLPTGGDSKSRSPVDVTTFLRSYYVVDTKETTSTLWASSAVAWAEAEELEYHSKAATFRLH